MNSDEATVVPLFSLFPHEYHPAVPVSVNAHLCYDGGNIRDSRALGNMMAEQIQRTRRRRLHVALVYNSDQECARIGRRTAAARPTSAR